MSGNGTPPSVAFFVCCESGRLEQQAILFARSLRRFGGRFSDNPIHAYQPRVGPELEPATLAGFEELGIELHSQPLNEAHHDYPFANKIYSGVAAERELSEDVIVFCDTDTVFLSPPDALDLDEGTDVAAAPAWHINKASQGPGHPMEEYWQEIYEIAGVTDPPWVETMEKSKRIRGYWNAGILGTRRETGIFGEWLELFTRFFEEERFPEGRMIVTDQVALAAAISRRPGRLVNLDHTYNYDIGRRSFFKNEMRADRAARAHAGPLPPVVQPPRLPARRSPSLRHRERAVPLARRDPAPRAGNRRADPAQASQEEGRPRMASQAHAPSRPAQAPAHGSAHERRGPQARALRRRRAPLRHHAAAPDARRASADGDPAGDLLRPEPDRGVRRWRGRPSRRTP